MHLKRSVVRRIVAGALVTAVAALPAGAQAGRSHRSHCGAGTFTATVNHRATCVRWNVPASLRNPDAAFRALLREEHAHAPKPLRHARSVDLTPVADRALVAGASPTLPGAAVPWAPTAVGGAARDESPTFGIQPSVTGSPSTITGTPPGGLDTSGLWWPAPGSGGGLPAGVISLVSEAQPYQSTEGPAIGMKVRTVAKTGPTSSTGLDTDSGGTFLCPDRLGNSPGQVSEIRSEFTQFTVGGKVVSARLTWGGTGSIVAHTNDQAKITDYDLDATLTSLATGQQNGHTITPLNLTAHVSLRHIPVDGQLPSADFSKYVISFTIDGTGMLADKQQQQSVLASLWGLEVRAGDSLDQIDRGGWDKCLSMVFSPPSQTFGPSESHTIGALVDSVRTGPSTVTMNLHALAPDDYTVTPTDDVQGFGTPASFTLKSPPTTPRTKFGPFLLVEGAGRQGKVIGDFTPTFVPAKSNLWDIEYKGSATYRLERSWYNPDGTIEDHELVTGNPSWDTLTKGVLIGSVPSTFGGMGNFTEQLSGTANDQMNGQDCPLSIVDASQSTSARVQGKVDAAGGISLITAPAYELTGSGPKTFSTCMFDMGPLNPGFQTTSPSGEFDPTEATQAQVTLTTTQLDSVPNGGTVTVEVNGPQAPITISTSCGSTSTSSCSQSLRWAGTVTLTRHTS